MTVSREQVVKRLQLARFAFNDRTDRVEIYRQHGSGQRVAVSLRKLLPEKYVRTVLGQARLTAPEIEAFLGGCVKEQ